MHRFTVVAHEAEYEMLASQGAVIQVDGVDHWNKRFVISRDGELGAAVDVVVEMFTRTGYSETFVMFAFFYCTRNLRTARLLLVA